MNSVWVRGGIAALMFAAASAGGQASSSVSLPPQLGTDARATIQRIIDSARMSGVPVAPLADKVAEGVLKGADDRRIVAAVQTLARELREAHSLLGPAAPPPLLGAAASALHSGVDTVGLLRLARPAHGPAPTSQALATALVTLVDLVSKRVPSDAAIQSMEQLLSRGAPESQYVALRAEVDQDIRAGKSPEAALSARMRARIVLLDSPAGDLVPPRRPPPL